MDQLKDALGGIFSFIKNKFPGIDFSKISESLPEADALVSKAETDNSSRAAGGEGGGAGGFLGSAMNMLQQATETKDGEAAAPAATGTPGAAPVDSMSELLGCLTKAGIDPTQIMSFLPLVAGFLKQNAGVDISSALGTTAAPAPGEDGSAAAPAPADAGVDVQNLMNQAQGFLGSFGK